MIPRPMSVGRPGLFVLIKEYAFLRASAHERVPLAGYLPATCALLAGLSLWVATPKKCLGHEWGAHLPCMAAVGWAEIKPHLGGHGANTQAPAVRPIRTEQRPNQQQMLPLAVSTLRGVGLIRTWQTRSPHSTPGRRLKKNCVPQPTQPWHKKHHRRRVTHKRCQARRLQGNTALNLRGSLAICNKMCKHGVGWAEIKPHLGGHGTNTQAPAVRPIRTQQSPKEHNKCCP